MRDYWYYGLRLRSDLGLTGLPAWPGAADAGGIVLRQGAVPERLSDTGPVNTRLVRDEAGRVLLRFPKLFRLLMIEESEALIEIAPGVPMVEVEGYLLSFVAGLVLHRRRVLPLHASCVMVGARAIAIAGHSGRGKSTLATALTRAGHALLADDITVVRFDDAGAVLAVPGSPHPRLNPDSIAATALEAAPLRGGRLGEQKRIWHRESQRFEPVPLAAVIRLDLAAAGEGPAMTRLSGPGAVLPLQDLVYRFALGRRLGAGGELAHGALRLAARVPIHRLARPPGFEALAETLALLLKAAGPAA
jgi:hypothetical protein